MRAEEALLSRSPSYWVQGKGLVLSEKQECPLGKFEIGIILGHGTHGCLSKALYPALCTGDLVYPGPGLPSLAWAPPFLQSPLGSSLLLPASQ